MSGVIDLEFLRENTFSIDNMRELIEIYLTTTPLMYKDLCAAMDEGDAEKVRKMAHKLKSNLNTMGISTGSEILDVVEHEAEKNRIDTIGDKLIDLGKVIGRSEEELNSVLQEL